MADRPKRSKPPKERTHTKILVLRVAPELKEALTAIAYSQGKFPAEVVRQLVQMYVDNGRKRGLLETSDEPAKDA